MKKISGSAANRSCDVFIAGSGLAGSTFARLLVDGGTSVLIADPGSYHSRRAGENRKNSWISQRDLVQFGHFVRSQLHPPAAVASEDYPNAQVSYAVGGMAVHWTCAIPEFHKSRERPGFIDDATWRQLYDTAAILLNRHDDVFHHSVRHRTIQSTLAEHGWTVLDTPMAAERMPGSAYPTYTGADTILGMLAEPIANNRFEILPGHAVRRLVRSSNNEHVIDHAELVEIATGATVRVHAKHFVVCTGWLHNAQLLWASGIHTHKGSALGCYFADHTFGACTVVLSPDLVGSGEAVPKDDPAPHLYLPVTDARPWQGMVFRESYQFDAQAYEQDLRGIDLK